MKTRQSFYRALSKLTGFDARDTTFGIRLSKPGVSNLFCPITAVCYHRTGELIPHHNYKRAGLLLGLPADETETLASSADDLEGIPLRKRVSIRKTMKKRLGL